MKVEEIAFEVMTPDELDEWFLRSYKNFDGEDRNAINTMNFFLKIIENWFEENQQYLDSYEAFINRELH